VKMGNGGGVCKTPHPPCEKKVDHSLGVSTKSHRKNKMHNSAGKKSHLTVLFYNGGKNIRGHREKRGGGG